MGNSSSNGLGKSTTAEEVARLYNVDLHGKTVLVTGANQGIGLETARVLASCNATVVLACRNPEAAQKACDEIRVAHKEATVAAMKLDLASLASVRTFAAEFLAKGQPLHLLINNAGVLPMSKEMTADGFESCIGVNHLGHFLLTNLLLPRLKDSAPARIVVVASKMHLWSMPDLTDINFERRSWSAYNAYGSSKSANILFTNELQRRLHGSGITANSVHPGVIATSLTKADPFGSFMTALFQMRKTVQQGAATTVYAAIAPQLEGIGGKYFDNCNEEEPRKECQDPRIQRALWELSEKAVGL